MTVFLQDDEVFVDKIVNDIPGAPIHCGGIIGAFNCLQADGFTLLGRTLKAEPIHKDTGRIQVSFSRRRHSVIRTGNATAIFIPTHDEMDKRRANSAKQFALYMRIDEEASASADAFIHAPAEFIGGVDETADIVDEVSNPYAVAEMSQPDGDGNDGNFNFWLL